jgi:DNA-binding beta-propeller fold protein YncE
MTTSNKFLIKKGRLFIRGMTRALAVATALCFAGCGESDGDNQVAVPPFDSSLPVEISDFTPKKGGEKQRLIIYGKNFGNDTEIIQVFIGGKEAKVIGVAGDAIYCVVPVRAFNGDIEVRIGNPDNPKIAVADEKFDYLRNMVVSTLFGYKNERDDQPNGNYADFTKATLFKEDSWMTFDPLNPNHLYVAFDNADVSLIDLQEERFSKVLSKGNNFDRPRGIDFTLDGRHMIVGNDQGSTNNPSSIIMSRSENFSDPQVLTRYRQCNGAFIHPVNGELYFNSFEKGQFFRFDLANAKYFGGDLDVNDYEELFQIQDVNWEFNIRIHPTGNYAYIVVVNQHYILRTDYNWNTKRFTPPYLVCGEPKKSGYEDAVGSSALLNRPYQGIFVKNPDYAGTEEEYDFYFTDCNNHCIRILTPDGLVSTFAGRGSSSLNPNPYGYVDGDLRLEARFDKPTGLAYDESTKTFYVGDRENRRIRKIAVEPDEEQDEESEEETDE